MKAQPLLPPIYRRFGLILLIPSVVFGLICLFCSDADWIKFKIFWPEIGSYWQEFFSIGKVEIANTIAIVSNLVSLLMIALSKEKIEDECIASIRARSMIVALWHSMGLVVLTALFFFGLNYIYVLIFNLYFYLIFYIIMFRCSLAKFYKDQSDEE